MSLQLRGRGTSVDAAAVHMDTGALERFKLDNTVPHKTQSKCAATRRSSVLACRSANHGCLAGSVRKQQR